jgi:ribonuclease BN (tRNA processing enzyme)
MQPSLVFLGTGQGPEVVAKQLRGSGGIILRSGDNQLHLDPGPSALRLAKMCDVSPRETTCILVSHHHLNHCNDVNTCINSLSYGGLDKRGVLISTNLLINGDEKLSPYLTDFHKQCLEKYMVMKEGQHVAVDDIEIKATKTLHPVENLGFQVSTPEFVVSYLSDTGFSDELIGQHMGSDVLILNVVNPFSIKTESNLNSADAMKLISAIRPRLAIISHFSTKMLQADPLLEARDITKETGVQTVAASDGYSLNLANYSARRFRK